MIGGSRAVEFGKVSPPSGSQAGRSHEGAVVDGETWGDIGNTPRFDGGKVWRYGHRGRGTPYVADIGPSMARLAIVEASP